jgi:hypothetical protein
MTMPLDFFAVQGDSAPTLVQGRSTPPTPLSGAPYRLSRGLWPDLDPEREGGVVVKGTDRSHAPRPRA